jgi:hypothetical protein
MGLYGGSGATYNPPGDLNKMGAVQEQQAMESQAMRRRALEQSPMDRGQEMRSGIDFGPGRANRLLPGQMQK